MNCLLCQRPLTTKLTLKWVLSWQPIVRPVVCSLCWQGFRPIDRQTACPDCGRAQLQPQVCRDCRRWPTQTQFYNQALFEYNSAMQAYFKAYKFQGDFRLRAVFQARLKQTLSTIKADVVVAIPVNPATMQTRGFNQVTGWLAAGENDGWLVTLATTKAIKQATKNRQDRLLTTQPFQLAAEHPDLTGKTVVIVDDVYTTGRTIRYAAMVMLENGAKSVIGLTVAR
ncbi:ComF family protein [Lactobacillus sp.] [Lactiplantibacillus mudanjiangensis]|uniref:ComF family protein n=1 Tax=Lactiplantibacillus mudanjiangensis TaxID=1296538 RepID=UPI0010151B3D|nr:ComF family protein [Lactobacillus sp.] [Lactiplantibacillus mudanjiangensis]VDG32343.1 ComF family protein [Lactobacillus sp.] [Lactiplantibacillus mudanjiangensis]